MFKKISVFLVLALVIGALSACASQPRLTKEKRLEIEQAWYAQMPELEPWCWDPDDKNCCLYYGKVNGYDIILEPRNTDTPVQKKRTIGSAVFEFPYGFILYAYKDGRMRYLSDLYNHGVVGDNMVEEVARRHANNETKQLSDKKKSAVHEAARIMEVHLDWKAKDGEPRSVRYYGNFDGYDVLFVFGARTVGIDGDIWSLDGVEFRIPPGGPYFIVYKDGEIYPFSGRILSHSAIEQIAEQHNKYDNG